MKSEKLTILTLVALLAVGQIGLAEGSPQIINYQGYLTDSSGDPVENDTYLIKFTIYEDSLGTSDIWNSGFQEVAVTGGLFNYLLGSNAAFPDCMFTSDTLRWLGIKVATDPEIRPLTKLSSVAYAFHAIRADTACYSNPAGGWHDAGSVVFLSSLTDSVAIGNVDPDYDLDVTGDIRATDDVFVNDVLTVNDRTNIVDQGGAVIGGLRLQVDGDAKFDHIWFNFDYESSWYSISEGSTHSFYHNLGGDEDEYIVIVDGKNSHSGGGIHQSNLGTTYIPAYLSWVGLEWYGLTSSKITVERAPQDNQGNKHDWDQVRVRIIKNQ